VVGGQAIGRLADYIGLFIGAMWRKDCIPAIRENWPLIARKVIYPGPTARSAS
jgi:hypothetical protein